MYRVCVKDRLIDKAPAYAYFKTRGEAITYAKAFTSGTFDVTLWKVDYNTNQWEEQSYA